MHGGTTAKAVKAQRHIKGNVARDFAPGQNHICFRESAIEYYTPNIFHTAPTMNHEDGYLPMLVRDVQELQEAAYVYRKSGRNQMCRDVAMLGNHPIAKVCIQGKVISERYTERAVKGSRTSKRHFLLVSDSSSDRNITVKLSGQLYMLSNLKYEKNRNKLLRISGVPTFFRSGESDVEIEAQRVDVTGDKRDLGTEIEFWTIAMGIRRDLLLEPWVYVPGTNLGEGEAEEVVEEPPVIDLDEEEEEEEEKEKEEEGEKAEEGEKKVHALPSPDETTFLPVLETVDKALFSALLRHCSKHTVPLEMIYHDRELSKAVQKLAKLAQSTNLEPETVLDRLTQKIVQSRLVRLADDGRSIKLMHLDRLRKYVLNLLKVLTEAQKQEIRKLLLSTDKTRNSDRYNRKVAKWIAGRKNKQYSLDLRSLKPYLLTKFHLEYIKVDHLNRIIRELINGGGGEGGGGGGEEEEEDNGMKSRVVALRHGLALKVSWKYDQSEFSWNYVVKLRGSD